MYVPSPEEIAAIADRLGFPMTPEEQLVIGHRLIAELETAERFMNDRTEARTLPLTFPARQPGHRPGRNEDPLNAWLWLCDIGGADGLLSGRTIGLKDHISLAGMPLTFAAYSMAGLVADCDATVATRVLGAGARVVGKLNMDAFSSASFGLGGHGDGIRVLNPFDPARIAGGSSSGAAAAVGAGQCDIALAGDQAGSIRVPASWCGVLGLKPTFGLVPHTGIVSGSEPTIDHIGPLTRTAADLAAVMAVISGPDGNDARQGGLDADTPDFVAALDLPVAGLRVGYLLEGFEEPLEPEVDRLIRAAVGVLVGHGMSTKDVSVPEHVTVVDAYSALTVEGARMLWETNWVGAFTTGFIPERVSTAIGRMRDSDAAAVPPNMKLNLINAELRRQRFKGAVYARAQNVRPTYIAAYDRALDSVDVLVMPTAPMTAPIHEPPGDSRARLESTLFGGEGGAELVGIGRNTLPFNYTGHPALSMPCGISKTNGMPVGAQLVARRGQDQLLIAIAAAYERAVGGSPFAGTAAIDNTKV